VLGISENHSYNAVPVCPGRVGPPGAAIAAAAQRAEGAGDAAGRGSARSHGRRSSGRRPLPGEAAAGSVTAARPALYS
jgi:hypothetical protein